MYVSKFLGKATIIIPLKIIHCLCFQHLQHFPGLFHPPETRLSLLNCFFVVVSRSVMSDSGTPWTAAYQASLSFTISHSLLKLMPIDSVMPFNHFILYHPLLLLPSIFPNIGFFPNESALCIRWPKYWSFSFSISPSKEYSGLISFRINWFDLLAVQGTLKGILQHHNLKALILQDSASLWSNSHPYMTTGKTIALTRRTFVAV